MARHGDRWFDGSTAALLVPVKSFSLAKARLREALDAEQRMALAQAMAETVISASGSLPVAVVCGDADVEAWATRLGVLVISDPRAGLNGAVHHGVETLAAQNVATAVVAHGDLPLARGLEALADFRGVTIVPDRHDQGTNVIAVPTDAGFRFSYGPGSFRRHIDEARRLGLDTRIVRDRSLAIDIDTADDLHTMIELRRSDGDGHGSSP